jgi:hypothetical protein
MYKHSLRRWIPLLWCLGLSVLLLSFFVSSPSALAQTAKRGQLQITSTTQGSPGTQITLNGSNFNPNDTVNLYFTTNGDQGQCTNNGNPQDHGLQPFDNNATFQAQNDGTFTQTATWPNAANSPNTQYFVCALSQNVHALSSNSFTVMQSNAAFDVTPTSVAPGGQITVTGSKWMPPQVLTVSVTTADNANTIASQTVTPGQDGNFSVQVTIPQTAQPGTYNVLVFATSNAALKVTKQGVLTITQATPTPAPTPTTAATPTAAVTATPTTTIGNTPTTGGGGGLTILIYMLGGIGVMMVIIGIVMFAAYR